MSIRATCEACGKTYTLNDKYAGRELPCKECGELFEVHDDEGGYEDDYDPEPRRSRRSSGRSSGSGSRRNTRSTPAGRSRKSAKKKRGSSGGPNWPLIIGASIGGLVAIIGLVVMLMFVFSSSPESMFGEMIDSLDNVANALEDAKDANSAKASADRIRSLGDETAEIMERMKKYDEDHPMTSEEEDELIKRMEEKYKDKQEKIKDRIQSEMKRIARDPEISSILMPAMLEFGRKLSSIGGNMKRGSKRRGFPF